MERIQNLLDRYDCKNDTEYKNALKEIIQDITLLGLWRGGFFEKAAFYGGTALRILYELDRFSEDLDFTLLEQQDNFNFLQYWEPVKQQLAVFGINVTITEKKKEKITAIHSAFLKTNTKEHILKIGAPGFIGSKFQDQELLTIKLEIDTQPAPGFILQTQELLQPMPFWVRTLSLSSLFAGKMHAVLCRDWGVRVKGRDWYDMLWFIQKKTPLKLNYLEAKMRQTAHYSSNHPLDREALDAFLLEKIEKLDIERAKEDIIRFIPNQQFIEGWSKNTFYSAVKKIILE